MTTAEYQQRLGSVYRKHQTPGATCPVCGLEHGGYHAYITHTQNEHPDVYQEFKEWAGLK